MRVMVEWPSREMPHRFQTAAATARDPPGKEDGHGGNVMTWLLMSTGAFVVAFHQ
ncbi:hypothetical protein [Teichococcus aerofrigidensis]